MPQYKMTLKIPIWGYLVVGVLLALIGVGGGSVTESKKLDTVCLFCTWDSG